MVIQRIQTLYLLLVAVLSAVTAFVTVGTLSPLGDAMPVAVTPLGASAQVDDAAYWWPAAILIAAAAVAVWAILSFKRLARQTALGVTIIIMLVCYYVMQILVLVSLSEASGATCRINWPLCLPLVAIVLAIMAIRAIKHDRKLLKDANSMRLRD